MPPWEKYQQQQPKPWEKYAISHGAGGSYGPDSVLGGAGRRLKDVVSGIGQTFDPRMQSGENIFTANPLARIVKGLYGQEKIAGRQAMEQFKEAGNTPDVVNKPLGYLRALVTGASMLNPFAVGSVANVNQLEKEGRHEEALGQGMTDVASLGLSRLFGGKPSAAKSINKLAYATEANPADLKTVLPDIQKVVKARGVPKTLQEAGQLINEVNRNYSNQFNLALQRVAGRQVSTQPIADALKAEAQRLPPDAIAERQALLGAAQPYDGQIWNLRDLNAARMFRNQKLSGFYNKGVTGQIAADSSASTLIDRTIADSARDLLYGEMDKYFPQQQGFFRALKQKQGAMIKIMDDMQPHIESVERQEAYSKGAPLSAKLPHARFTSSGMPHMIENVNMRAGANTLANRATRQAFKPTAMGTTVRGVGATVPLLGHPTQQDILERLANANQ